MDTRVERCIHLACDRLAAADTALIYFRADDIAVPGARFLRMMELFSTYRVPLSLAVVPAWLTAHRWNALQRSVQGFSSLWCWHQHGWRHKNHEFSGRSQEFGPARLHADLKNDLLKGRRRLKDILGRHFYPVFTPPWNRCNLKTLELVKECGFLAVSRDCAAQPTAPQALPDFCVDIDLHTRKVIDRASGWRHLFEAFKKYISSGRCGIMLHHRQMNAGAFDFLEILIKNLKKHKCIRLLNFKDLVKLHGV